MKQKPCIFTGKCQFGKLTIEVLPGDGQYIKHEAKAYCTIFDKRYEETVYDDDITREYPGISIKEGWYHGYADNYDPSRYDDVF